MNKRLSELITAGSDDYHADATSQRRHLRYQYATEQIVARTAGLADARLFALDSVV